MKYFLWLIGIAIVIFALFSASPVRDFVGAAIPGLLTKEGGEGEAGKPESLQAIEEEAAAADKLTLARPAGESGQVVKSEARTEAEAEPEVPKFDRKLLIGGWLAETNSELIILREDGQARVAIAWKYETPVEGIAIHHATVRGVGFSSWEFDGANLEFKDSRFQDLKFSNLKYTPVKLTKEYDAWDAVKSNEEIRRVIEPKLRTEANRWLKKNRVGGQITQVDQHIMVIQYKDGPVTYERVNPFSAKDPDGTHALIFVAGADGTYHEK